MKTDLLNLIMQNEEYETVKQHLYATIIDYKSSEKKWMKKSSWNKHKDHFEGWKTKD